jgi:DNA-binding MarR family transcriptional regulator
MPDANLDQGFGFLLNDVSRLLRREFERRVRGFGLTRPQWILLSHLGRHPGSTLAELADWVQQEKITVSRQVTRLEKGGWLQRRDPANDGKPHGLKLTPKGGAMLVRLAKVANELLDDTLVVLEAGRREALIHDLSQVRTNLERMGGAGS